MVEKTKFKSSRNNSMSQEASPRIKNKNFKSALNNDIHEIEEMSEESSSEDPQYVSLNKKHKSSQNRGSKLESIGKKSL